MPRRFAILCSTALALFGSACASCGHDIPVHWLITQYAAESALQESIDFKVFLNVISNDGSSVLAATNYMVNGSGLEDGVRIDAGGLRSYNHFYDPLDNLYGHGLSDYPPEKRLLIGRNSFDWASTFNCFGINFPGEVLLDQNENTTNVYSWQNARVYESNGLTALTQSQRQSALTNMFRAVGQVMHLLEDASQPQHVRNEQHLSGIVSPWRSPIEDYGLDHQCQLNYQGGMLAWQSNGFTKLQDFWDRQLYDGANSLTQKSAVLNSDANGGPQLGLAEWCNANFLGDRHSYAEYYLPGSIEYYPFPSRNTSTDFLQVRAHLHSAVQPLSLKNGAAGQAIYLHKTGDGILMTNFSRFTYFGAKFPGVGMMTIRDDNVLAAYHNAFIPKAVSYAAGLIDYYFRGTLAAGLPSWTGAAFNLSVTNASTQDFSGGSFRLFYDDSNMNRTELTNGSFVSGYSGALAAR